MNRHKLIIKKENMMLILRYKFGDHDSAASARKCYLSIQDIYLLNEGENRARHGTGKVYRNSL